MHMSNIKLRIVEMHGIGYKIGGVIILNKQ